MAYFNMNAPMNQNFHSVPTRYYDPEMGRFLGVDPLFESFMEHSPYSYCNNSPVMFRDPSGLGIS